MRNKLLLILIALLFTINLSIGQVNDLYIPVSINSPLFKKNNAKEIQVGLSLNNYGGHLKFAMLSGKKIVLISIQANNGFVSFDPLGFNKYLQNTDSQMIETYPSLMKYGEAGFGYNFNINSQKISLSGGIGYQIQNKKSRYFIQLDWGNESRIINSGVSVRANYTTVNRQSLFILEPVVHGKLKLWNFRFINEFGYAIALKKHHHYMKPVLTIGIEYVSND